MYDACCSWWTQVRLRGLISLDFRAELLHRKSRSSCMSLSCRCDIASKPGSCTMILVAVHQVSRVPARAALRAIVSPCTAVQH